MKYWSIILWLCTAFLHLYAQEPQISYGPAGEAKVVIALDKELAFEEWENYMTIHKIVAGAYQEQALAGTYVIEENQLAFYPLFSWGDASYIVRYGKAEVFLFQAKSDIQLIDNPQVKAFFPSQEELPQNTLCFYIQFDQEMFPDSKAYRYVQLLDASDQVIMNPWRQQSFWIKQNTVLVVMVHPGRIKSGIYAAAQLSALWRKGEGYRLLLESGLRSVNGQQLARSYSKKIFIGDKDEKLPSHPELIEVPLVGVNDLLRCRFSEPMDYGLVWKHMLVTKQGKLIEGEWDTKDGCEWSFKPTMPWDNDCYELKYSSALGDIARNELYRAFEVKEAKYITENRWHTISFVCKNKKLP